MHAEDFRRQGYCILPSIISGLELQQLERALEHALQTPTAARQMLQFDWCNRTMQTIRERLIVAGLIGSDYVAVQCTYFEKSAEQNWLVASHQDLSIPVKERVPSPALAGWSEKDGALFVQAPIATLESLVALRLHIDDCGQNDGALRIVEGSHRLGRLDETSKSSLRQEPGEVLCPVEKGGGMAMSPLLLHASSKSTGNSRRRVLHFLFGPSDLPHGLSWATAH